MATLYPPLSLIRRELFGPAPASAEPEKDVVDPNVRVAGPVAMPDSLLDLISRRVAADRAWAPEPLAVGQIRRVTAVSDDEGQVRQLGRTCGFLLGRSTDGRRWTGWMVAQEADYATDRDLVLQDDDGLFAPEAAMVQTWNEVSIELKGDEAILGKVSATLLGAVLKLSDTHRAGDDFVPSRPGRIGAWDLDEATTVVTGTPLGEADDPRVMYQQLYHNLAAALEKAPQMAPRNVRLNREKFGWMGATLSRLLSKIVGAPGKNGGEEGDTGAAGAGAPLGAALDRRARLEQIYLRPNQVMHATARGIEPQHPPQAKPGWMKRLRNTLVRPAWTFGAMALAVLQAAWLFHAYQGRSDQAHADTCRTSIRIAFKPDTPFADLVLTLRRSGATVIGGLAETGELWILPPAEQDPKEVATRLRQSHLVEKADIGAPQGLACKT